MSKEDKKEKSKKKNILVLRELPKVEQREAEIDGKEYDLITIEEALEDIMKRLEKVEKAVAS